MKNKKENLIRLAVFLSFCAAAVFIFSCSDSTTPEIEQGQIKITMVDAPTTDYDEINIVVTRVEVHKSGTDSTKGWSVINNNAATYDLLTLRNGASVVIGNNLLDAGHYTQIRLIIGTGSNIVIDGVIYPLEIPIEYQTELKLTNAFEIQSGLLYELILDFDAEHSIVLTANGQYMLKPVIRVMPMIISGTISGKITPLDAQASVYAISGTDTINCTLPEITTGSFLLMALIQGTYDVTISSGNIAYNDTTITNVTVIAQQNTDLGKIILSVK